MITKYSCQQFFFEQPALVKLVKGRRGLSEGTVAQFSSAKAVLSAIILSVSDKDGASMELTNSNE